jgi:hypothetical protein
MAFLLILQKNQNAINERQNAFIMAFAINVSKRELWLLKNQNAINEDHALVLPTPMHHDAFFVVHTGFL